jgi:hypothetical protein
MRQHAQADILSRFVGISKSADSVSFSSKPWALKTTKREAFTDRIVVSQTVEMDVFYRRFVVSY